VRLTSTIASFVDTRRTRAARIAFARAQRRREVDEDATGLCGEAEDEDQQDEEDAVDRDMEIEDQGKKTDAKSSADPDPLKSSPSGWQNVANNPLRGLIK
jgi:hypothetical protein